MKNWNWLYLSPYVYGSIFVVWWQHKSVICFAYKGSNPVKAQNQICLCKEFWPTENERFQYRTFLCSARKWSKHVGYRMSQGGRINLSSFPFKCWNAVLLGVYFPFLLSGNTKLWLRLKNNDLINTKLFFFLSPAIQFPVAIIKDV